VGREENYGTCADVLYSFCFMQVKFCLLVVVLKGVLKFLLCLVHNVLPMTDIDSYLSCTKAGWWFWADF
jgi:hypothetical protein